MHYLVMAGQFGYLNKALKQKNNVWNRTEKNFVGFAEPMTQHQNIIIKNLFENKSLTENALF